MGCGKTDGAKGLLHPQVGQALGAGGEGGQGRDPPAPDARWPGKRSDGLESDPCIRHGTKLMGAQIRVGIGARSLPVLPALAGEAMNTFA